MLWLLVPSVALYVLRSALRRPTVFRDAKSALREGSLTSLVSLSVTSGRLAIILTRWVSRRSVLSLTSTG